MNIVTCPVCGTVNPSDAMNCSQCRINLQFALERSQGGVSTAHGLDERKEGATQNETGGFWLVWVVASAAGFGVGFGAGFALTQNWYAAPMAVFFAVTGTVVGGVVGVSQWLVLRGKISQAGWWVLASILGWGAGFAMLGATMQQSSSAVCLVGVTTPLFLVGVLQWLVLRGKISEAGWWILASVLGCGANLFVVLSLLMYGGAYIPDPSGAFSFGLIGGAVGGALYGSITGAVLVWRLRHHIPDAAGAIEVE